MFYQKYPELEQYYDKDKNGERQFTSYSISSNEVVYWKCKHGHSFKRSFTSIHVADGRFNCPVCDGILVVSGVNDLATQFPKLAKEYDVKMNHKMPQYVSIKNSNKNTYWKCEQGHSFQMPVSYRVSMQTGCPICSGQIIRPGVNDLKTKKTQIVGVWDYSKNEKEPEYVSPRSNDLFWWQCEKGHSFQAGIEAMENNSFRCLICDNKRTQAGINSLVDTDPELCKEISPNEERNPNEINKLNAFSILWQCPTCHGEYYYPVNERELHDDSCPYCHKNKPLLGYNTLVDTDPELVAKEWSSNNEIMPSDITKHSYVRILWECSTCHGEYYAYPRDRELGDTSCPYCNKNKPLLGFNTLVDTHPELVAKEWSPNNEIMPSDITKHSYVRILWECSTCHGEYYAYPRDRELGDTSCPYCNKNKPLLGYNTLVDTHPELLAELSPNNTVDPTQVTKEYTVRMLWQCSICNGEYYYPVNERELHDDSCPYCHRNKPLLGFNTLQDTDPELAKEWSEKNEIAPEQVTKQSYARVLWECPTCHGEYYYSVREREVGDESCPYCSNRLPLKDYNTLNITNAEDLKEWYYVGNYCLAQPNELLAKSYQPVWWKCSECGSTYLMSPKQKFYYKMRHQKSCPYCKGRRRIRKFFF